ncbi:MAG: hypothetical protein MUP19_08300 [Candidatus Aminicenantes bacterium]|nr:hypothetical protein [Candidatus Aminicenantes bacterium]
MSKTARRLGLCSVLILSGQALASNSLFYLEAAALAGYSSGRDRIIFYSRSTEEPMQKPSLGFDYVLRISGKTGDVAVAAFQGRLAWNADGRDKLEPQLYNAYIKFKSRSGDLWIGHNRPELGLSSYLDSHALLLQTLAMDGFGFDRDWGLGLKRDTAWGGLGLALTTGSGMPLAFRGNHLFSARASWGVLARDNFTLGLSGAAGKVLETMVEDGQPQDMVLAGLDAALLWNNLENRLEVMVGQKGGRGAAAFFWRAGINLLDEGRLKIEAQPAIWKNGPGSSFRFSAGLTYLASADLTFRALWERDPGGKDTRWVIQMYYYRRMKLL